MATRPLTISPDGRQARLPEGMPLSVYPAVDSSDAVQLGQTITLIAARVQYSQHDIQAGVTLLPPGHLYLVYE
jgi:hypothetical protein